MGVLRWVAGGSTTNDLHVRFLTSVALVVSVGVGCGKAESNPEPELAMGGASGATFTPSGGATFTPSGGAVGTGGAGSGGLSAAAGAPLLDGPPPLPISNVKCEPGLSAIPARLRLTNFQYANTIRDLLGVTTIDEQPISELLVDVGKDAIDANAMRVYQDVAQRIAEQVMTSKLRDRFLSCEIDSQCLEQSALDFGRKAFRRPLTEAEQRALVATIPVDVDEVDGVKIAQQMLQDFLVAAPFLYREFSSAAPPGTQGGLELTQYSRATRLSYLLWGSTPDPILSAAADASNLYSAEQLRAQAERLLRDPRAREGVFDFHRRYLGIGDYSSGWFRGEHDPASFPNFAAARDTLSAEVEAFFDDVTFSRGSFADLFLSRVGFVSASTAQIYGLSAQDFDDTLTRTELDPEQRPGFLTRASFLSSFSNYRDTSPIQRGVFLSSYLLGISIPPPPPPMTTPLRPVGTTQREYFEALYSATACNPCHVYVGPPGYALENYDAIGAWQDVDPRGGNIDPVANVFFGDQVQTVKSPLDLMQRLARSRHAQRHYADTLVSYAFERPLNPEDACLAEKLAEKLGQGAPLLELWTDIITDEKFRSGRPE